MISIDRLLNCLYYACLELPLFHINDVFVTGFAASACNATRIHSKKFAPGQCDLNHFK